MSEQSSSSVPAVAATSAEVASLHQRINDLIGGRQHRPVWYRNTSLITSFAAIFISVMTTAVSWYRTYQQDITSLRSQLTSTLQQASAVQIQFVDLSARYKDDQASLAQVSSIANARNLILSQQAYTLARALGDSASAVNLTTIAYSLMQSNEYTLAEDLVRKAIARAENSLEYISAHRLLGAVQFYFGNRGDAEAAFNKALEAFTIYSRDARRQDYVNYSHAFTRLYWAQGVALVDCRAAKEQLALSAQHAAQISPASRQLALGITAQIAQLNQMLMGCS